MNVVGLSYSTTPLSEYLGSHIYESIGVDTHETKLGIANGKLVVACKDFLNSNEVIVDYNSIKNEYDESIEQAIEALSSSSINSNNDIEEILLIMEKNSYFKSFPELKKRFWDMFVIDAFINNNDRNEGNWGLILDKEMNSLRLSPVFDNGASFYNKSADDKINIINTEENRFIQSVYHSSISIYKKDGKIINPLKYIESMENDDCNQAILRIVPNINIDKIAQIFEEIPEKENEIAIISKTKKEFYLRSLKYRYTNILVPIYEKILEKI